MNTLLTLIIIIQVLAALVIIGLVLVQHGKGADMGAAFGSGASGSLFGAAGSSNFLSKSTAVAAAVFFGATLALAYFGNKSNAVSGGVLENLPTAPAASAPAPTAPTEKPAAPAAGNANTTTPANTAGQSNQIPK